ncbi:RluA family pseudouridine synthase [Chloroflexota bacterium]
MIGTESELQVETAGGRLDKYLAERVPELSRSAAQRLVETGQVTVNGEPVRPSYKVRPGDLVVVAMPPVFSSEPMAEEIDLEIVHEDSALLVIDKSAGMVVHPAPGHPSGTLVNALLAYCPELAVGTDERPGIVHRLDRDTSGLIVVAKSDKARRALQRQFKDREVQKSYMALLDGYVAPAWGRVEAPVGRDPQHRQRMRVMPGGREAVTEYHVIEQFSHRVGPAAGQYTLVEAEPKTGRTHQIRVHFASIGHPVVADPVYGRRRTSLPLSRQFLHAWRLGFRHPTTGHRLQFEAPPPADLAEALVLLRRAP